MTIETSRYYLPQEELSTLPVPKSYDCKQLEERFEKKKHIGGGGDGAVYLVLDKESQTEKVLKLSADNHEISKENQRVAKVVDCILRNGLSPHLTKLELVSFECLYGTKLDLRKSTSSFFNGIYESMPKKFFLRRAYVMEKLEGDLEKNFKNLTGDEKLAFEIQGKSAQFILNINNVVPQESKKYRNILYKKLGPDDLFQGKKLQDFDFWKYGPFYLPRPEFLIKLADYDPWYIGQTASQGFKFSDYFQEKEWKELSEKFPKPSDPNAKVIEIFNPTTEKS